MNTSASLYEVHRDTDKLDNISAPSRPRSRNSDMSASLHPFNAPDAPILPDMIFQFATWLCANSNVLTPYSIFINSDNSS